MYSIAAVLQDGLTFREVVRNLPHDGPALFVYLLIILFVGFVWHGSRGPGSGGSQGM
jgi:hypothetical protein